MNTKIRLTNEIKSICEELGPEDGIDPRTVFSKTTQKGNHRKMFQLCKEIQLTLALTLEGEIKSLNLKNLTIVSVEPIPESSDVQVLLAWNGAPNDFSYHDTLTSLKLASGFLRSQVAQSINRKRVPQLSFRLLYPNEVKQ